MTETQNPCFQCSGKGKVITLQPDGSVISVTCGECLDTGSYVKKEDRPELIQKYVEKYEEQLGADVVIELSAKMKTTRGNHDLYKSADKPGRVENKGRLLTRSAVVKIPQEVAITVKDRKLQILEAVWEGEEFEFLKNWRHV